jgi:hypothetical protein
MSHVHKLVCCKIGDAHCIANSSDYNMAGLQVAVSMHEVAARNDRYSDRCPDVSTHLSSGKQQSFDGTGAELQNGALLWKFGTPRTASVRDHASLQYY